MPPSDDAALLSALALLRTDWPNESWTWDGRLPTASSAVRGPDIERAQALALRALTLRFDPQSITSAPTDVRTVVERSGGLRGNQLAFCAGEATQRVFGLWWPWGDEQTVSLRIGFIGADRDPALAKRLRELFGITA